jgi:hypothetical protein
MFTHITTDVTQKRRNHVGKLKFYLADVKAFDCPIVVLPDVGGPPNSYNTMVKRRAEWLADFAAWLRKPYEQSYTDPFIIKTQTTLLYLYFPYYSCISIVPIPFQNLYDSLRSWNPVCRKSESKAGLLYRTIVGWPGAKLGMFEPYYGSKGKLSQ